MGRGSPSMVALLGLLAVAGYQNRDKLSDLLAGAGGSGRQPDPNDPRGMTAGASSAGTDQPGIMDNLRGMLGGAGGGGGAMASGGVMAGLSELLNRFTNPVQSAKANTWVDTGPNSELTETDLEEVLDAETLDELSQKTGLDRRELLARLSKVLPEAVDRLTPEGRLPGVQEPTRDL